MSIANIEGLRFGRLVAKKQLPPKKKGDGFQWLCVCDCGAEVVYRARSLTYKKGVRSCGCILREKNRARPVRNATNTVHGDASTKKPRADEYTVWSSMIQRCTNPKHRGFKWYGGRGVVVCAEWLASYEAFLADMGRRPSKAHSLDRTDPDGPYSPENCRWATAFEQANNRRNNVSALVDGLNMPVAEVAALFSVPQRTLYRWAKTGEDIGPLIRARLTGAKRLAAPAH